MGPCGGARALDFARAERGMGPAEMRGPSTSLGLSGGWAPADMPGARAEDGYSSRTTASFGSSSSSRPRASCTASARSPSSVTFTL